MPNKHKIRRVVSAVYETPWAITHLKLEVIADLLDRRQHGHIDEEEIEVRLLGQGRRRDENDEEPYRLTDDGIAIVSLYGVLGPRMNWIMRSSGGTSVQEFAAAVQQAADDPDVRAIVLDIDSPGGNVLGVAEAAETVRLAGLKKDTVAVATGQMCSAAYYIGSAAKEVIASPSSEVGSIGVYSVHSDYSAAETVSGVRKTVIHAGTKKTHGNAYETLNQAGRESMAQEVDDYYQQFVEAVANYRGVSVETVQSQFGQGSAMIASRARAVGLIDRIATLSEIVAELGEAAGDSDTIPIAAERISTMDPKIMDAFRSMALISVDSNVGEATAALNAWYASKGKPIPLVKGATGPHDEFLDAEQIVKDLTAKDEPPVTQGQAAMPPPPAPPPAGSPAQVAEAELQQAQKRLIEKDERQRISDMQAIAETFSPDVDAAFVQQHIDAGTDLDDFRALVIPHVGEKRNTPGHGLPVGPVPSGPASQEKFHEAAVESLLRRQFGSEIEGTPSQGARELEHISLMDLARESLCVQGARHNDLRRVHPDEIIRAAMRGNGAEHILGADSPYQTPGDFPYIMSALASKALDVMPEYVGTTFQYWAARRQSVPDRKPATLIRTGEFGEFPEHVDGDTYEQSSLSEERSWIQAYEYGDEFGFTPMMMEHDDLGALMDALGDKRAAHDQTLNRLCVNLLVGNVTIFDGVALFHAVTHVNDIATGGGAAPSTAQLSAVRLLLRQMTGQKGRQLNQTVWGLLIPEALETTTQQLLLPSVTVMPVTTATGEIFRGQVKWWVEPMLTANSAAAWYSFANPARSRSIVYCYQRGYERMRSTNYYNPQNNCRIFQFAGRFAAGVNNYRGVIRNAGL